MNIKALRQQTQSMKVEGRERPWLYRTLQRGPSIYITALIVKTRITPNQISMASIVIGLAGASAFLVGPPLFFLLGLLFLYFNILLDKVDGEVARFKNQYSVRGVFLDEINHLIVPPLAFMGLTLHILSFLPLAPAVALWTLLAGIAGSLGLSFIRTGWSLPAQIFAKKFMKHPERFTLPEEHTVSRVTNMKREHRVLAMFLGVAHQFQEFFMLILVFFVGALVQLLTPTFFLQYLVIGYGILLPLIVIENTIKGYWGVEKRVRDLHARFSKERSERVNGV